jgi:hypothetical protein
MQAAPAREGPAARWTARHHATTGSTIPTSAGYRWRRRSVGVDRVWRNVKTRRGGNLRLRCAWRRKADTAHDECSFLLLQFCFSTLPFGLVQIWLVWFGSQRRRQRVVEQQVNQHQPCGRCTSIRPWMIVPSETQISWHPIDVPARSAGHAT